MEYIVISACLLGLPCRYDGAEKADEKVLELLNRDDILLIPLCPEQLGGMATPREPAEQKNGGVLNKKGEDVTEYFKKGANQVLKIAKMYGCTKAILKERSPSCGCGKIYDGNFTRTLIQGDGITTELLKKNGIEVVGESKIY